jgi:hypothetical protein
MTVQPAIESPRDAAADAVVRAVAAARRRLRVVHALQLSALSVPAGVAVGAALALAGWAPLWTSAALAVFGALAAAAWAAAQTPPTDTVARTLDTRLGLRDRVAAALQLQPTGGPIATLVARDAAARLAPVDVTALFPLALGRAPAVMLTVAVALVAWSLSSGTGGASAPDTTPTAGRDSAPAGEARRRAPEGSRAPSAETERAASQPRPTEAASQQRNDPRRAGEAASAAIALPRPAQPAAPATESTGRSTNAPAQNQPAESAQAASNAGGRSGRGGSATGLTPSGASLAGAGGAARGNPFARGSSDRALPTSAAAYRAARASAEAALGRDEIPPDYREHVRAYFSALPAAGTGGAR